MAVAVFVWDWLRHAPLRDVVLGRAVAGRAAVLPGFRVLAAEDGLRPVLVGGDGAADGLLLDGLSGAEVERIAFFGEGLAGGCDVAQRQVLAGGAAVAARVIGAAPVSAGGLAWDLDDWARDWGATLVAAAEDAMPLMGQVAPAVLAARRMPLLVRAASRVRAGDPPPATLRRATGPDEVHVAARRQPYARFFAVEEYDLTHPTFGGGRTGGRTGGHPGGRTGVLTRAAFVSGDAVTVLPYDPLRDRVLLVEQFRTGPYARGDAHPWSLEAVAGRIDPGETPEAAARREAAEEAGLDLGRLIAVAGYYPSPGAKTEFLYSYVALTDLPNGVARLGGLAEEGEDIRGHLVEFDRLMDLIASGEVNNAPLILTALWLQRERPRLRGG